jgi:putative oxidoreductase
MGTSLAETERVVVSLAPPRLDGLPFVKEQPKRAAPFSPVSSMGLFLLRLGIGLMMLKHGIDKATNFDATVAEFHQILPPLFSPLFSAVAAIFAELVCSLLVLVGLATRLAVIPLAITMSVAVIAVHWGGPFEDMETALLYGVCYLALLFTGPGSFSVDRILSRMREPKPVA